MSYLKNSLLVLLLYNLCWGQFSIWKNNYNFYNRPAVTYQAETLLLLARMTTQTATRQTQIDNLIASLKTAEVWAKLDVLQVYAADAEANALLNWKGTSNNAVNTGSATFTADQGFTGDGSSKWLSSGFMPATHGVNYTQNSASMGVYDRTAGAFTTAQYIVSYSTAPIVNFLTQTSSDINGRINSAATGGYWDFFPGGGYTGFIEIDRYSATGIKGYLNGRSTKSDTIALTSTGLSVDSVHVLKAGQAASNYCPHQVSALYFGSTLSATEHLKLYSALETYLDAVGCGVVPCDTLLIENAEGTGYDGGIWTEAGTVNEDTAVSPLRGAQSIWFLNNSASIHHYFSYSSDTCWAFCLFNTVDATPSTQFNILALRAVTTTQVYLRLQTNGRLNVNAGTANTSGTTTLADNTTYYIWFKYIVGTGANASVDVYLDTDNTIPASAEATATDGTANKRISNIIITGAPAGSFVDQILVTKNNMGDVEP